MIMKAANPAIIFKRRLILFFFTCKKKFFFNVIFLQLITANRHAAFLHCSSHFPLQRIHWAIAPPMWRLVGLQNKGSLNSLGGTYPELEKSLVRATEQRLSHDALLCIQMYPSSTSLVGLLASPPLFPLYVCSLQCSPFPGYPWPHFAAESHPLCPTGCYPLYHPWALSPLLWCSSI